MTRVDEAVRLGLCDMRLWLDCLDRQRGRERDAALRWYANENNYEDKDIPGVDFYNPAIWDAGERARTVLSGEGAG